MMVQKLIQTGTQIQREGQILTPQQLLVVSLLELPISDLEDRVRNELIENTALEETPEQEEHNSEAEEIVTGGDVAEMDYDAKGDFASEDDVPEYLLRQSDDSERGSFVWENESESFYDKLLAQMGEYSLTEKQRDIIEYLIGSLDSDGLLRKSLDVVSDELSFLYYMETSREELQECLDILKGFEPCGIASQSLQECLIRQLQDKDCTFRYKEMEIRMLTNSFEDFTHKRLKMLCEKYEVDVNRLRDIYAELSHLNPRPGSGLSDSPESQRQTVIPDFIVKQDEGDNLNISLNRGDVPLLRISQFHLDIVRRYAQMKETLSTSQREAYVYSKQKVDAAQNFINAILLRNETMLKTIRAIVERQTLFFLEGDNTMLKPMRLKDIAADTGLNQSTISRITGSKYVLTDFGVFPLKSLFSEAVLTSEGEEVSKVKVKTALKEIIEQEDRDAPLSDQALVAAMKKMGFDIARRTITKYREQMGIPKANLRK